jgi:two-component system sensor histidine kinase AgrC
MAETYRIKFHYHIGNSLSEYPIPEHDLIEILVNLINNAFEEVVKLSPSKRTVSIEFNELSIVIINSIKESPEDNNNPDLFREKGYSTKGEGRGYGITNIIALAEKNHLHFSNFFNNGNYVSELTFEKRTLQ